MSLRARLRAAEVLLAEEAGQAKAVEAQRDAAVEQAAAQEALTAAYEEACSVIGKYADTRQNEVRELIETLVTKGLLEVFEDSMTFHVRTKMVGRRMETFFTISSPTSDGGEIETDILSARGGGVASVVGFLLRVIFILLHKAPRVLFLDETFAQVSENYEPRLAEFIDSLCDEYGVRMVLVTHSQNPVWADIADTVYTSSMEDGETVLRKTK